MKKFLSIIVLTALVLTLDAQITKKNFNVAGFSGINAGGVFSIELIKSNNEKVTVETEAELLNYVNVRISNNVVVLSIDNKIPKKLQRNMKPILVTVYMKEFSWLSLSGASRLITDYQFTVEKFSANLSGASKVFGLDINSEQMKIVLSGASEFSITGSASSVSYDITGAAKASIKQNCESLKMEGSGAAKISVEGAAKKIDISFSGAVNATFKGEGSDVCRLEMSGASNFNSLNFPVKEMVIKLSGVSNAKVNVIDSINVSGTGGSKISYKGDPQIKSLDMSSVSSFRKIN